MTSKALAESLTKSGKISFSTGLKSAARYLSDPDPEERKHSAELLGNLLKYYDSRDPIKALKLCGKSLFDAVERKEESVLPQLINALGFLCRNLWLHHAYEELRQPLEKLGGLDSQSIETVAWLYECLLVVAPREEAEQQYNRLQQLSSSATRLQLAANLFEQGDLVDWRAITLSRAAEYWICRSLGQDVCEFRSRRSTSVSDEDSEVFRRIALAHAVEAVSLVERRLTNDLANDKLSAGERGFQSLPYALCGRLAELRGDQPLALEYYLTAQKIAKKLHLQWRTQDYDAVVKRLSAEL